MVSSIASPLKQEEWSSQAPCLIQTEERDAAIWHLEKALLQNF